MSSQPPSRTRRWLLLLGVIIVASVPAYIEFFLRRPVGEGPAGPMIPATDFDRIWTERPVVLLGLGDSVTRGLGAQSQSHTYFARLQHNPVDEFADMQGKCLSVVLPNLTAENFAVSGSTSIDHLQTLQTQVPTYPDDVFGLVVMTTGGNDLIHSYGRRPPAEGAMYGATIEQAGPWIENFRARLRTIFDEIQSRFPGGCVIYVGDIYDPTDGVGDAPSIFLPDWPDGLAIHAKYNAVIREVAAHRDHVHVVDLYETFLGHGSHCRQFWRAHYDAADPHYWFYDNIEDPNDRGHDAIRRVFLKRILKTWERPPDALNPTLRDDRKPHEQ
ncbi:SGNH/GDSL hydrolase family protein [Allorhodopirellula heiligendammensis]|uniref:GDSL-like Lipase/Acylhydrolase n=1 Tax=Allorhodopirellula heiligendammensis TaxID=2714739 RepID=A0A5C6BXL5_9BACT|nr:SGNH/GDSL hydrolase family protein [Allorhodopirellula heiligendammensis]TWU16397.1 GDSL-like Lipase/Acylhydrolase [Allorhodopirellula heiligendammensis]